MNDYEDRVRSLVGGFVRLDPTVISVAIKTVQSHYDPYLDTSKLRPALGAKFNVQIQERRDWRGIIAGLGLG